MKRYHITHFALLLSMGALLLAGCGGNGVAGTTPAPSPFRGNYEATIALDAGKTGKLALTVANDAKATGTLTVTVPPARGTYGPTFSFSAGSFNVSGNVTSSGAFDISGTDPIGGAFSIDGSLPTSGNGTGSLTVRAGGQTFTSSITLAMGSGSGSLTFTNSGANINASAFPANPYVLISTVDGHSSIVAIPSVSDNSRSFSVNVNAAVKAGDTIDLTTSDLMTAMYSDSASGQSANWISSGGSIKVIARTANTFEFQFQSVKFTSTDHAGSFTVSGTLKK